MKNELKTILRNMEPRRNLKWFWNEYIRFIRPDQEICYTYFSNMMNEFCVMWPEIETKIKKFINENK
jgi:hypothetical protein